MYRSKMLLAFFVLNCLLPPCIEHPTKAVLKGGTLWPSSEHADFYQFECATCGEPYTFCLSLHVKPADCYQSAHLIYSSQAIRLRISMNYTETQGKTGRRTTSIHCSPIRLRIIMDDTETQGKTERRTTSKGSSFCPRVPA